ncbi:hypothetical protein BHAOGJBA_6291 [Methylobacterium hispanicum]|uniref:Uncharacterized protein n=1 Tax=Methylobacterium hispanicum TaxID=270350 RepID=A0AAV4ZVX2_9HYPH|nr:hypothetical protein BHAOGJBA_6291 [Methylobacterium hispanicum]
MKRDSAAAITQARANRPGSATRWAVAWKVECSGSTSRANCLGMLAREAGHSRVPEPPHRITGWTADDVDSGIVTFSLWRLGRSA